MPSEKRALPAKRNLHNIDSQIMHTVVIIFGFWLTFFLFYYLMRIPYHELLENIITPTKYGLPFEYTMGEQLAKFYLFIIVLISVLSYQASKQGNKIKLSISFLMLGLIMYMSESNMITENTQPIFGFIIVASCSIFMLRVRSWLSLGLLIIGFIMVACGSIIDLAHEKEIVNSLLPPFIYHLLDFTKEDHYETLGIAFLCLSSILCFQFTLLDFLKRNKNMTLLILLTSGTIAFGNGFLHWHYSPSWKTHLAALLITISGFLGLWFFTKSSSKKNAIFELVTEEWFYIFIFVFFVVLPSLHGRARSGTDLFLWLPTMFFLGVYLWRHHPANCAVVKSQNRTSLSEIVE
ncbi:MAG: hypothetical protein ACYTEE_09120 [Planctomycetota bacterium]